MDNIYYHKYLKYKKKYLELQKGGTLDDVQPSSESLQPKENVLEHGFTRDITNDLYNELFGKTDQIAGPTGIHPDIIHDKRTLANPTIKKKCLLHFNKPYLNSMGTKMVNIGYEEKNFNTFWLTILNQLQIVPTNKINNVDDRTKNTTYNALQDALTLAKKVEFNIFNIDSSTTGIIKQGLTKVGISNVPTCKDLISLRDALIGHRNIYIKDIKSFIGTLYEFPIDVLFCFTTWVDILLNTKCNSKIDEPNLNDLDEPSSTPL